MIDRMVTSSQYGWRSKGEIDAAYAAVDNAKDLQWGDTISLIAAYDRIDRAMSNPMVRPGRFDVHDRTYVESHRVSAKPLCQIVFDGVPAYTAQPNLYSDLISTAAVASDNDIRAVGGNMLRESRPTKPHANLSQWFGELYQFGGMFDVPHELPEQLQKYSGSKLDEFRRFREGGRAVGSGYLAGQFGWLPFVGEVINSLDTIANSGPLLDEFVRNSAKLIPRKRRKTTYQDATSFSGILSGAGDPHTVYTTTQNRLDSVIGLRAQKTIGLSNFRFKYDTTVTRVDSYRSSALYEYFVADPSGFLKKAKRFSQEAKYLLGDSNISLSTFWELTPWSWAIDWSFNLGGLLSFQESVAEDGLVARRCSTVWQRDISVVTHWEPFYQTTGNAYVNILDPDLISVTNYRQQRRLAGSPYDMGIDWSGFSTQKWFILGALGLTKAPGVKP